MQRYLIVISILAVLSAPSLSPAQTAPGEIWRDLSIFALDAGDYDKAAHYARKALDSDKSNPEYQHLMGIIHIKTERYGEARRILETAYQADPEMTGLKYDLGYACYKTSDFKKASKLFKEIAKKDPGHVQAVYYSGICLFNLNRFDEALDYFIDAAGKSPNANANSRYYAGICYVKTGKKEKALEMFEYVSEQGGSEKLKESADKWIVALKSRIRGEKPYYLFLKAGFQYDDNVGLDPPDREFDDEFGEEEDYAVTVFFSGGWDFFKRNRIIAGAGYNHYQSWYMETSEYNLTASMFRLYSAYSAQPFDFSLEYAPSFYWVDTDSFLTSHRIKPAAVWEITNHIAVGGNCRFTVNDYEADERDGNANGVFLNLAWTGGDGFRIFTEAGYEMVSADYDIYTHDLLEAGLIVTYKLPTGTVLKLSGHAASRGYDERIPEYDAERDDDHFTVSLSLSHNLLVDWLKAELMYEFSENSSNIEVYDYERNLAGISVSGIF